MFCVLAPKYFLLLTAGDVASDYFWEFILDPENIEPLAELSLRWLYCPFIVLEAVIEASLDEDFDI